MQRLMICLIFTLLFSVSPAQACDVNLFAIITGASRQDAFSEGVNKLAVAIKNLGQNATNPTIATEKLHELMSKWMSFSGSFGQMPPDWAKGDTEWQKKFGQLTDIIGQIRIHLVSDAPKAHALMLKFSRCLPQLYSNMTMEPQARALLEFTACFDLLWDAFYAQNLEQLRVHVGDLKQKCLAFQKIVAEQHQPDARVLHEYAERLRIMTNKSDALANQRLQMLLSTVEGHYVLMNEHISGKPPEIPATENATPTAAPVEDKN